MGKRIIVFTLILFCVSVFPLFADSGSGQSKYLVASEDFGSGVSAQGSSSGNSAYMDKPFAYPARIIYRLFTSVGVGLLLMIRTIWNIIKDYNENHKASAVWSAVGKYLLVVAIVFFCLTIMGYLFGSNTSVNAAIETLRG